MNRYVKTIYEKQVDYIRVDLNSEFIHPNFPDHKCYRCVSIRLGSFNVFSDGDLIVPDAASKTIESTEQEFNDAKNKIIDIITGA